MAPFSVTFNAIRDPAGALAALDRMPDDPHCPRGPTGGGRRTPRACVFPAPPRLRVPADRSELGRPDAGRGGAFGTVRAASTTSSPAVEVPRGFGASCVEWMLAGAGEGGGEAARGGGERVGGGGEDAGGGGVEDTAAAER